MLSIRILLLIVITMPSVAAPYSVQCYDFGCKTNREIHGSAEFAVDTWHRNNGELACIQPPEDWKRERGFRGVYNLELAFN